MIYNAIEMTKFYFEKLFTLHTSPITADGWSRRKLIKKILVLGLPLIVGELGSIIQQFADTMMVGHHGTTELAAAGFVNSIFYYVIFLTLGMSFASTSLVGSAFGNRDFKSVSRIFFESIQVGLLVGVFFIIVLVLIYLNIEKLFYNSEFEAFHQPFEILADSKKYFRTLIWSVLFLTLFYACKQYLDGIGNTRVSMWILLASNLLNIILNYCLIFGKFGCPELGLYGAGLATLIARIFQLFVILIVVFRTEYIRNYLPWKGHLEAMPTKKGILEQIKLGYPISFQLGLEIGIFNFCGIMIGWIGEVPLAAHQTMYTISTLCFQVLYGIGAAGAILISYFYAMRAYNNVRRTAKTAFWVGFFMDFMLIVLIITFFKQFATWFTEDDRVIEYMWMILPSLVLYQIGDCIQIIYANALRGIKVTKPLAKIASVSYIAICVPICYIITFKLGYKVWGAWSGIPIGLLVAGVFFYRRFCSELKRLEGRMQH